MDNRASIPLPYIYYVVFIILGIDLNRIWDNCSPHTHPTAHAVKSLIEKLTTSENPLDFVLDIHVSNTLLGFFVVGNAYDSVFR